ncbi:unnamed protein product, partial [Symbiodinium necroappetens]
AAVKVIQGALDSGADLAIYLAAGFGYELGIGGGRRRGRKGRGKGVATGEEGTGSVTGQVGFAGAVHCNTARVRACEPFGRKRWRAAAAMDYVSVLAFYAAMGRGELQADAKAAEDRRMREIQARYPHANRETGEGFPALPRKPARNASAAVAAAAHREYRTLVEERKQLCSAEWRALIRAMEAPGAQSTEPIVHGDLQQLAVANLAQLGDIEHQAATGEGQMMPLAGAAAYFFVRSLAAR